MGLLDRARRGRFFSSVSAIREVTDCATPSRRRPPWRFEYHREAHGLAGNHHRGLGKSNPNVSGGKIGQQVGLSDDVPLAIARTDPTGGLQVLVLDGRTNTRVQHLGSLFSSRRTECIEDQGAQGISRIAQSSFLLLQRRSDRANTKGDALRWVRHTNRLGVAPIRKGESPSAVDELRSDLLQRFEPLQNTRRRQLRSGIPQVAEDLPPGYGDRQVHDLSP
jgi:hypothetical protein